MAGSETRLDVAGSTEEAQRAIDKLTKKVAELRENVRTMRSESVKGAKDSAGAHEGLAASIGSAAAKVTSLSALVGTAYGDWQRRLDEISRSHDDLAKKIGKGLSESATLEQGPMTQKWLREMNAAGVTKDHALTALEQVSKAGDLSPERQREIAGEAGAFGKTGADVGSLGRLAAEIDKASGGQMSANDVMDTAMGARRLLGDKANMIGGDRWQKQLSRMRESGMDGKEALNTAFTLMQRDENGNAMELMDKKLRRSPMSSDERKDFKRLFDQEAIQSTREKFEAFRTGDFAAQQLANTPPELEGANVVQLKKDANVGKYGAGVSAVGNVEEARRQGLEQRSDFSSMVQRAFDPIYRGINAGSRFVGLESAEGQAQSLAAAGVKAGDITQGESKGLLAELQGQSKMLADQNRILNRPQSRNVDRHTE